MAPTARTRVRGAATSALATVLVVVVVLIMLLLVASARAERQLPEDTTALHSDERVDFELVHIYQHNADPVAPRAGRLDIDPARHRARPVMRGIRRHTRGVRDLSTTAAALPDPTDKATVLRLAEMSSNAYTVPGAADWRPIDGYDKTPHPLVENSTGLQGYVFGTASRDVLVMAIKGTSLDLFNIGGPTAEQDRLIDNTMFSCCCARVNFRWTPVCGCYTGGVLNRQTCDQKCLETHVRDPATINYFGLAKALSDDLRRQYPHATIWYTGHSLGGALAALVALDARAPAFCYEAPGERLYAQRLGLSVDVANIGQYPIYHFGNTADPIFTGTCQGVTSSCYLTGYAMETACHIGHTCVYKNSGIPSVNEHRISHVIDTLIVPMDVPPCTPQTDCTDCADWTFQ